MEFALVATFLVRLAMGVCELGTLLYQQLAIDNATWAGAAQASLHGWTAGSPGDITTAVSNASGFAPTSATATELTGCDNNGTIQSANPSGKCSSGLSPGTFVIVTAQASASLLFPLPGVASSLTLSSTAVARIK